MEVEYSVEVNFSWTYWRHDSGHGSIWHQMIRGHGDREMSRWEVKQDTQTHGGKKQDEMSPPRHECRQTPCLRATYCQHDNNCGSFYPTISLEYPGYFWMTSLTGITYAWEASFRWNPMSLSFNESDKGITRRLFMFREFEKTAEKETPGVSFFRKVVSLEPEKV